MAVQNVQFVIGMINRVSGPAKAAGSSVSALTLDLRAARAELQKFNALKTGAREFGSSGDFLRYSDAARQARERIYGLQSGAISPSASPVAGLSAARLGPVIGAVTLATAAITAMTAAYGGLTIGALRAANAQQSFERQTRAAFTGLAGGDKRIGDETFDLVDGLSKRLPVARQQLVDWTKALQESGINSRGALRKGVIGLASAQAVGGEEGATTLLRTLRRVQEAVQTNHGLKLADRQLAQLAKTGANVKDVADELGISTATLQQRLKAGTQEAGAFGTALLTAVQKKGSGPLKAMWLDIDLLEKKAFEFGARLFRNADLSPLTDALQRALSLTDDLTGRGLMLETVVSKGTSGIARALGRMVDQAHIAFLKMAAFALDFDTAMMPAERTINRITSAMNTTVGKLLLATATLGLYDPTQGPTRLAPKTPAQASAAQTLYAAAGAVARARQAGVKGDELQKMADQLGASIAAGVNQGMISHAEGVKLTGIALGKKALEGVKGGAQVRSPSRATYGYGVHIGGGLALGMRASAGGVGRAGRYLGEQATRASLYVRPGRDVRGEAFSRGGGGGSGGTHIDHVDVSVTAPAGVTSAEQITAWGLAVALEQEQLMGGA